VAVIRISGPAVRDLTLDLIGELPLPRYATLAGFRDAAGEVLDLGLALFFPAPHSFTGEDVLELHAHGGPVLTDLLVERVVELGARLAERRVQRKRIPQHKLDLAQAEISRI
jgi:tRNA modification GTPase